MSQVDEADAAASGESAAASAALPPDISYPLPFRDRLAILISALLAPALYLVLILLALVTVGAAIGMGAAAVYLVHQRLALARASLVLIASAVVMLAAAAGIVRAVFAAFRAPAQFDPAIWINPDREPALMTFIADLCQRVGAKAPDAVLMHILPTFAVMQGRLTVLNANPSGRILILSLPLLGCMSVNELRAVLAHEFAHFTGGDTLYGAVACRAYASLMEAGASLHATKERQRGLVYLITALPLMAPLTVLRIYHYLFTLLAARASRGRELRADAIAAQVCGARSFENGLKKAVAYAGVFQENILRVTDEIVHSRTPTESPYRSFRKGLRKYESAAHIALERVLDAPDEKWDSHPSLPARLNAVPKAPERYADNRPALELIAELQRYEKAAGEFIANEYQMMQRAQYGRRF